MFNNSKRTTKEYAIDNENKHFVSKYGTLNKEKPSVIYIKSKAKFKPKIKKKEYKDDVQSIKKVFEKYSVSLINESNLFNDDMICICTMSENNLAFNKSSNFKYDIFIKPQVIKPLAEYDGDIEKITIDINNKMFELMDGCGFELR